MKKHKISIKPKEFLNSNLNPLEYIIKLYESIGWDKKTKLEPTKILLSPKTWQQFCEDIGDSVEKSDKIFIMFAWVNNGPSSSSEIPDDEIWVEDGAF